MACGGCLKIRAALRNGIRMFVGPNRTVFVQPMPLPHPKDPKRPIESRRIHPSAMKK